MPSPKIKLYQLPTGYTQESDNDVQLQQSDELLPIIDKQELLSNVMPLTGIIEVKNMACIPIDPASSRVVENLSPSGALLQNGSTSPTNMVVGPSGYWALQVLLADNSVLASGYTVTPTGIQFAVAPSGIRKISYFLRASTPATRWALPADNVYDGINPGFNKVIVSVNGGNPTSVTPQGSTKSYVITASATGVQCLDMWSKSTTSRWFCGDHQNWVMDHMRTSPDIFVGLYDYPGDSGEVNGTPFVQGPVPKFRDLGTYQPDFRAGLITFPEYIDSTATPVKANYAYLAGIQNVTGQVLEPVDGTNRTFKAINENVFPESHGKRWITRTNDYMPFNVYVDGEIKPKRTSVIPFDVLTPVTA